MNEAADFKSAVYTNFTTQAKRLLSPKKPSDLRRLEKQLAQACIRRQMFIEPMTIESRYGERKQGDFGGARRSRTALAGFAIQCITDLLSRRFPNEKGQHFEVLPF